MDKAISKIYHDASHPAGFSGYDKLRKYLPRRITSLAIKNFLLVQESHTIHKPTVRRFKRDVVFSYNIDDNWQADLMDVRNISHVFSKYLWARCLKDKSAVSVRDALKDIFESSNREPITIQSDKGRELINKVVQKYLEERKIRIYSTENSDVKASVAERVIRTLKSKMYKYFTYAGHQRYIEVLSDLVHAYNDSSHRTIGMPPSKVDDSKVKEVWEPMFGKIPNLKNCGSELKVGDYVRISKTKRTFEKGYEGNWSKEIFKIKRILQRTPMMYELNDYNNDPILGRFYRKEIQRVLMPEYHTIDKILRTRHIGSRTEYFVSWKGYPSSCNSWVKKVT
ncbi:hypothetical protein B566_EDAN011524 [Ephemera danica]|nr:hypothetical protein B566_EDAN011524 [Ephemera danica]